VQGSGDGGADCEVFVCSKIGAKSFEKEAQNICKHTKWYIESNLQPVAGF